MAGFTLIELIGVVGIIAILLGFILTAVETVHRYSRKAVAQAEVRTIEDAWKRYFDHYNRWPTSESSSKVDAMSTDAYLTYRLDATVGAALEGRVQDNDKAKAINGEGVHFMEFTRYGKQGETSRTPVNPWYRGEDLKPDTEPRHTRLFYYVRFDVNANNLTSKDQIAGIPPNLAAEDEGYVRRSVIVWTYNPDDSDEFIASWTR